MSSDGHLNLIYELACRDLRFYTSPEEALLVPLPVVSELAREQFLSKLGGYRFSRFGLDIFGIIIGYTDVIGARLYIWTLLFVGGCFRMGLFLIVRCDFVQYLGHEEYELIHFGLIVIGGNRHNYTDLLHWYL